MWKTVCVVACVLLASSSAQVAGQRGRSGGSKILEFGTMFGVADPYRGATNAIRGINGAGAPWVIDSAKGELHASGHLELGVRGLVLTSTGLNPSANFRAIVSCLTKDAAGLADTENLLTGTFPATTTGDAEIETALALPSPCIAPIVFVTNAGGTSWFAVTGQ